MISSCFMEALLLIKISLSQLFFVLMKVSFSLMLWLLLLLYFLSFYPHRTFMLVLSFSSRHGIIFETLGSLLSLLRTGDRDAYRQFFEDAMGAVEGRNHRHTNYKTLIIASSGCFTLSLKLCLLHEIGLDWISSLGLFSMGINVFCSDEWLRVSLSHLVPPFWVGQKLKFLSPRASFMCNKHSLIGQLSHVHSISFLFSLIG